ncbi:hypothetical protein JW926_08160, partial [Candidatus Sumerlaeota bacterium]|nr:hypothetical protein [Candidatus Sumerlaeota bacterium]
WEVLTGAMQDGEKSFPWRYTTKKPGKDWQKKEFDDKNWDVGKAPFGSKTGWDDKIRTPWKTKDIWLRQEFEYNEQPFEKVVIVMHYDNRTTIFLNGEQVLVKKGWNDQYDGFDVTDAIKGLLKKGKNLLAVHVHQDTGGQYIDLAILLEKPGK